jgi:hypothetical protein
MRVLAVYMNEETNQIRGGDPLKAVIARWTLDRLYKHEDLIERLKREEYRAAWEGLSIRAARGCLLKALAAHKEIQDELAQRTGQPVIMP